MLLGGLWHGANWTFIIWGAYHGILLYLDRILQPHLTGVPVLVRRWATFFLVILGWVLFRADNLHMALAWLGKMFAGGSAGLAVPIALWVWVVLCFGVVNSIPDTWHFRFEATPRWAFIYAAGMLVAYICMNGHPTVFLYYQF
jgi:alginate O-acetyltransferase complex protein AlgI